MVEFDLSSASGDDRTVVSKKHWFVRGLAVSMLFFAAINAGSYFFRSHDWSSLVRPGRNFSESLGFPWVMWEGGNNYGGMFVDYASLGWNVLAGAVVSVIVGVLVARRGDYLNQVVARFESESPEVNGPVQFSIKGIMVATLIIAVAVVLAKNFAAKPETLVAVYIVGPAVLVAIAMLPRNLAWQKRVAILVPITIGMILVAVFVGSSLDMEFDKVLFGIFLCWTPQSALAAIGLSGWFLATAPSDIVG